MSRADRYTSTTKKDIIYSDFLMNLDKHPLNGSLARSTNENAVKQAIKNLILTEVYERPYQPQLGSKLYSLLFDPMNELTEALISKTIEDTIRLFEPRASLISVDVFSVYDRNEYNVNILFSLVKSVDVLQLDLIIKRIR